MSEPLSRLLEIMARLRDPDGGCPWDIEQSFETIAPYTIEEAYEVADAIARKDFDDLKDELGDLLLQVVYHAQMAREAGHFDFAAVAQAIGEKMVRRHPHVFGDTKIASAEHQSVAWEDVKARERKEKSGNTERSAPSALDGVPLALPALMRAEKLGKRAARVGFDWKDMTGVLAKIEEELAEFRAELDGGSSERQAEEIGDLLFACANLARKAELDPETALRAASRRFEARFRILEKTLRAQRRDAKSVPLAELEEIWRAAKAEEMSAAKSHS
ncbi:MAG: nucleoside triphosphate pyrophosphohydrolase [Alphaproteobacteria bacterium]|nr:nucleoside triphosphate pyrophosphohydrolase [Alphaproteobacteria bacterium]